MSLSKGAKPAVTTATKSFAKNALTTLLRTVMAGVKQINAGQGKHLIPFWANACRPGAKRAPADFALLTNSVQIFVSAVQAVLI